LSFKGDKYDSESELAGREVQGAESTNTIGHYYYYYHYYYYFIILHHDISMSFFKDKCFSKRNLYKSKDNKETYESYFQGIPIIGRYM
jgi:hypothetical protein